MPNGPIYCIDSSSLIEAWVRQFPPDVVPSFWSKLDELVDDGSLIAPEEVRSTELRRPAELRQWARDRDPLFRELETSEHQRAVTEVVDRLRAECRSRRLRLVPKDFKADPFVIALARVEKAAVINEEIAAREANARPKIPNLCALFGLRSATLLEFTREQGWRF